MAKYYILFLKTRQSIGKLRTDCNFIPTLPLGRVYRKPYMNSIWRASHTSLHIRGEKKTYFSYHLNWSHGQVSLGDQSLMDSHIQVFLSQGLDNSIVAQQWFGSITCENQTACAAVQLSRKQQVNHRRLHMLLLVLICVKWILQFVRDAVWGGKGRDKIRRDKEKASQ